MGKPHPVELRSRVIGYGDEGHGHRQAARYFRVSPKFVNDLVKLRRETGCLTPRRQGNGGGHGRLVDVTGWLGGYNFQWAWASAHAAARGIAAEAALSP